MDLVRREKIISIIKYHAGYKNAISVARIAKKIDEPNKGLTNPVTRKAILEIIQGAMIPICSNGNGYYLIETEDELSLYEQNLRGRIAGIRKRLDAIRAAFYERG